MALKIISLFVELRSVGPSGCLHFTVDRSEDINGKVRNLHDEIDTLHKKFLDEKYDDIIKSMTWLDFMRHMCTGDRNAVKRGIKDKYKKMINLRENNTHWCYLHTHTDDNLENYIKYINTEVKIIFSVCPSGELRLIDLRKGEN